MCSSYKISASKSKDIWHESSLGVGLHALRVSCRMNTLMSSCDVCKCCVTVRVECPAYVHVCTHKRCVFQVKTVRRAMWELQVKNIRT
jgi:hypothetical protein